MAGKWQLGNTRGRTEGRKDGQKEGGKTENKEGAEGGPEAADSEFGAEEGCRVWGCSLFSGTPTTACVRLLIIGKMLLQTALAEIYKPDI